MRRILLASLIGVSLPALASAQTADDLKNAANTPQNALPYGMSYSQQRFSPLTQIDRSNVAQLQVAWTYRTGALDQKTDLVHKAAFEATPILVGNKLFLTTPYDWVIALNPMDGQKLWEY